MKKKLLVIVTAVLCLISCGDPGGDPVFEGITVSVWNDTGSVINAQLYIGALKNNVFIPTDSVALESIEVRGNSNSYYSEYNRWNPDLDLIKDLGVENCSFSVKFSNGRSSLLQYHGVPVGKNVENGVRIRGWSGRLSIGVYEKYISGHFYDGNTYEGLRFSVSNTDVELENAKILIGGMKNKNFIATDSVLLPNIYSPLSSLSNDFQLKNDKAVKDYYYKINRWKPNLDLIRAIPSDSCYFKLILPNGRESLLKNNKGELAKTEITNERVIRSSDGLIQIQIQKDSIKGNFLVYNKTGLN
jgi:hypothetical protein